MFFALAYPNPRFSKQKRATPSGISHPFPPPPQELRSSLRGALLSLNRSAAAGPNWPRARGVTPGPRFGRASVSRVLSHRREQAPDDDGDHFSCRIVADAVISDLPVPLPAGPAVPHDSEESCERELHGLARGGCSRAPTVTSRAVRSYRTLSPLPDPVRPEQAATRAIGGLLSVAIALAHDLGRVGVTHHRVLSCSDFPPVRSVIPGKPGRCTSGRLPTLHFDSSAPAGPCSQSPGAPRPPAYHAARGPPIA